MKRKCDCGGSYKAHVVPSHNVSALLGFERHKVVVRDVQAWVCGQCGHVAIDGMVLERLAGEVALWICRAGQRLTDEQAKYLREMLGISQKDLADRLGINRVTVARWESGALAISPQHDYMLRALTLAAAGRPELAAQMADILGGGVHGKAPPERAPGAVIEMAKASTVRRPRASAGRRAGRRSSASRAG
jgi:YgiT-type zinc finger domain-containing protein